MQKSQKLEKESSIFSKWTDSRVSTWLSARLVPRFFNDISAPLEAVVLLRRLTGLDWPLSLCRGTGVPLRRTQAPPGPFEIFWCVRYGEKFYCRCGPLPTPLVVMITKLSLIGIPSKNSISLSDWLQLLICLHKAPIKTRCIRSFIKPSTLIKSNHIYLFQ